MTSEVAASFVKPSLHLVIAEDQVEWSAKLEALAASLRQWPLSQTGQFELSVHTCRSAETFKDLVNTLLADGALVYATLDLKMPLREADEVADERAGREMVNWCLDRRRKGEPLEFCLVSEQDKSVERLYDQSPELEAQGVKRIYKSQILHAAAGQMRFLELVNDIQSSVRRQLSFCTVTQPDTADTLPIWFGRDDGLVALLARADRLASSDQAGVYLLFGEAGGYEIDWMKLCCDLRGLQLRTVDFGKVELEVDQEWKALFKDPPEALLVRGLDYVQSRNLEVAPLVADEFFAKVAERNSLVFFQFPFAETYLDASKRLDVDVELPILDSCLRHLYQDDPYRRQGVGFTFADHRRIIIFPTYAALCHAGVIAKVIDFQVLESGRQYAGCDGLRIDPELQEVLTEIPWDRRNGGLQQLRACIKSACRILAKGGSANGLLTEEHFRDRIVPREFKGELGFRVRGRRLYRLLENRDSHAAHAAGMLGDPERSLRGLETLFGLYGGLDQLRRLHQELGDATSEAFSAEDYSALQDAGSFLEAIFESPERLRHRIDRFRLHANSPGWRLYYPTLETRRSKAAVENIRFSWPFTRLPLHPALAAYLNMNRVRALIHHEIDGYLESYPDLADLWEETEQSRDKLFEDIMQREEEREKAASYAREKHSQPVLVHLVPRLQQEERRSPFPKILTSFLTFNCALAFAENHYVFGGGVLKSRDRRVQKVLDDKVELGPRVGLIEEYTARLHCSGQLGSSVFHAWGKSWASESGQPDAVRLTKLIAGTVLDSSSRFQDGLADEERKALQNLAQDDPTSRNVGSLMNVFLTIRNSFYKNEGTDFEDLHGASLRDLLRRLVMATTETYRLGTIGSDGTTIKLWHKEPLDNAAALPLTRADERWQGRLVIAKEVITGEEESYEPLFPIDDLIRVRPERGSIWGYYRARTIWTNLTHVEGSDEDSKLSAAGKDWLPG
ncbi:MAG TPA: hypothetical protein VN999_15620, partial [Thermoanaerobaculia bacterium]|nr:hypothetical protein [Thermoanaerobaculia bacterium]